MSMIFRFCMLSDENDNFVRDYEVSYDTTLLDFHNFLLETLEYEPCMASFFTADAMWEKQREFTLMEMGESETGEVPQLMEEVTLGQILHHIRDRLIYLFDVFGDRAYYLELTGVYKADPEGAYPREIFARDEVPDQYDPSKNRTEEGSDGSIFDQMMDEFNDFEGDETYDDEY